MATAAAAKKWPGPSQRTMSPAHESKVRFMYQCSRVEGLTGVSAAIRADASFRNSS